jgi:hypothetical protein
MSIRFEGEVADAAGVNVPTYEKAEHEHRFPASYRRIGGTFLLSSHDLDKRTWIPLT